MADYKKEEKNQMTKEDFLKGFNHINTDKPDMTKKLDITCEEFLKIAAYITFKEMRSYLEMNPMLLVILGKYTSRLALAINDNLEETRQKMKEAYPQAQE